MNDRRIPFTAWNRENGDPLSDESAQALIDKLSDEDRDKLVQLAARRLAGEGIAATTMSGVWIGACYDIMRDMIENDISLDEVDE